MSNPHYERLGGETGIRALVERFYDLMDSRPELAELRAMHAKSLKMSREKLFEFLSGWTGGPGLYEQKYGHPRLRMRHMPFAIDNNIRDQWMSCMHQALKETVADATLREELEQALTKVADFMRNRPD